MPEKRPPSAQQRQRRRVPGHRIDDETPVGCHVVLKTDQCSLDDTRLRELPWRSRSNGLRVEFDRHQLLVRADEEQLPAIATPPRLSAARTRNDHARRTGREAFDDDLAFIDVRNPARIGRYLPLS